MAEDGIVRKDEIVVVRADALRVAHMPEPRVALLPDCFAVHARGTVALVHRQNRRAAMNRLIAVVIAVVAVIGASHAQAQEALSGPGTVVVTIIPAGGTFFTEGKNTQGPSFGNYDLGGGVEVNFNRYVGIEGEVSGALGIKQDLQLAGITSNVKTPNLLNYSGNLVVSAANRSSVVPYATGGIGGLSLFDTTALGITDTETFLTSNVGGGVKWFNGRWGLRGDYRFIAVRSKDDAPSFFGQETRYGHRVYGGVLINAGR
jgi:outer membrane protein with beta-barrel domain